MTVPCLAAPARPILLLDLTRSRVSKGISCPTALGFDLGFTCQTFSAPNLAEPDTKGANIHRAHRLMLRVVRAPWNRLGGLVAALGVATAVAAFVRFRRIGTTVNPTDPNKASHLVTDGVFRVSRYPMYLGLLLLLIGWAIWLGSTRKPWRTSH